MACGVPAEVRISGCQSWRLIILTFTVVKPSITEVFVVNLTYIVEYTCRSNNMGNIISVHIIPLQYTMPMCLETSKCIFNDNSGSAYIIVPLVCSQLRVMCKWFHYSHVCIGYAESPIICIGTLTPEIVMELLGIKFPWVIFWMSKNSSIMDASRPAYTDIYKLVVSINKSLNDYRIPTFSVVIICVLFAGSTNRDMTSINSA